ncbi:MAG: hypothetical protein HYU36_02280, partial [Planctomycetes bacterium]|nr:hypothetical protein [Planctomycetota bacterium]
MSSPVPSGGDYKVILSAVDGVRFDAVASHLAALLGIDAAGAQMIARAAPIILIDGLSAQQAAHAGRNTLPVRQSGADLQVARGPVGKLKKATWPDTAFPKILQRLTASSPPQQAPGTPAGVAAADAAAPALEKVDVQVQTTVMPREALESAGQELFPARPSKTLPAAALASPAADWEASSNEESTLVASFFICPHCGMKFELKPLPELMDAPEPMPARPMFPPITPPRAMRPTPPLRPPASPGLEPLTPAAPEAIPAIPAIPPMAAAPTTVSPPTAPPVLAPIPAAGPAIPAMPVTPAIPGPVPPQAAAPTVPPMVPSVVKTVPASRAAGPAIPAVAALAAPAVPPVPKLSPPAAAIPAIPAIPAVAAVAAPAAQA